MFPERHGFLLVDFTEMMDEHGIMDIQWNEFFLSTPATCSAFREPVAP